jgi:hypothetical protein
MRTSLSRNGETGKVVLVIRMVRTASRPVTDGS